MHRVEDAIRFVSDGRIVSDDKAFDAELNEVLNLNQAFLRNNRKETLKGFLAALDKRGQWPRAALEGWLQQWNGESGAGELQPFCQVVVYWLRKRLLRA
jgi:hypothetical protein